MSSEIPLIVHVHTREARAQKTHHIFFIPGFPEKKKISKVYVVVWRMKFSLFNGLQD